MIQHPKFLHPTNAVVRSLFVLVILLLAQMALAQDLPIKTLDPKTSSHKVWDHLSTLRDPTGQLGPQEVWQRVQAGGTERLVHEDQAYAGWIAHPAWAHVRLHNPSPEPQAWWLTFRQPTQDHAQVWTRVTSTPWQDDAPWRPLPLAQALRDGSTGSGDLFPTWRIALKPGQSTDLLLRIEGHNRMRYPLLLQNAEAFAKDQQWLTLGIAFVYAIPLVIMVYVLTLWRLSKDASMPLFMLMGVCEAVGAAWVSGLWPYLFPSLDRATVAWWGSAAYVVLLGASCLHAQVFLSTHQTNRILHRVLQIGAVWWLLLVPIGALVRPDWLRLVLLLGGTTHAVLMVGVAALAVRQGPSPARWVFFAVWCIYLGSGLVYLMYRFFSLPVAWTLISNYLQGPLVVSLLGWAVVLQLGRSRRRLEQRLERSRERARLYAAAHHDLWQPLQSVQMYRHALGVQAAGPGAERLLRGMDAALHAVADFMHSLRYISDDRPDAPVQALDAVELRTALRPVLEEFQALSVMKQVHLKARLHDLRVRTHTLSMVRIVRNLLSNALRYTGPGGRIRIVTRKRNGHWWLLVLDTGVGMSEAQARACFEAFTRFDEAAVIPEGLGLGLYSVHHLAAQLGAKTHLASRQGHGTVVGISLVLEKSVP
jgi:signal transduction histidine kinase